MYECKVLVMAGYDFDTKEPKEQAFIQHIPVSGGYRQNDATFHTHTQISNKNDC